MSAHYEIVDGTRLPARLAGHPALDFCNTLAGWNGGRRVEYLQSYDHLALWAGFAGQLDPRRTADLRADGGRRAHQAAAVLDRARRFRADLYRLLRAPSAATRPTPAVAEELRAAMAALALRRTGSAFEWQLGREGGLAAPLLAVAWSAANLMTSPDLEIVRACPGTGCGWLFLDRRGRRRWCSMATCGNRAKARRFSASHRPTAAT